MKHYLYLKKFLIVLLFASALGFVACGSDDGGGDDGGGGEEPAVITIELGNGYELSMVRIKAGTFTMGSADSLDLGAAIRMK